MSNSRSLPFNASTPILLDDAATAVPGSCRKKGPLRGVAFRQTAVFVVGPAVLHDTVPQLQVLALEVWLGGLVVVGVAAVMPGAGAGGLGLVLASLCCFCSCRGKRRSTWKHQGCPAIDGHFLSSCRRWPHAGSQ